MVRPMSSEMLIMSKLNSSDLGPNRLNLNEAERLFAEKDAAYRAQQAAWAEAYEKREAARAAGTEDDIIPCLTRFRDAQQAEREWQSGLLAIEREAARVALLDTKFRSRDFNPRGLSSQERQAYEQWLYGGPKPPPDPVAERLRWRAKLFAVFGGLLFCASIWLGVSAAIVAYFHGIGFLVVVVYWISSCRRWRAVYRVIKKAQEEGEGI